MLKWQFLLELSLFLCTFASEISNGTEDNLKQFNYEKEKKIRVYRRRG